MTKNFKQVVIGTAVGFWDIMERGIWYIYHPFSPSAAGGVGGGCGGGGLLPGHYLLGQCSQLS